MADPRDTYKFLVSRFSPQSEPKLNESTSDDTVIGVRIRPLLEDEIADGQIEGVFARTGARNIIDLHERKATIRPVGGMKLNSFEFAVDRLYDSDASTEDVYEELVAPLLPLAWAGGIGTLFAYGQTGSGKTFTVSGIEKIVGEELWSGKFEGERTITMSIIELAGRGNSGFDLLNSRKPIAILEDSFGETRLVGATEARIKDAKEMHELIDEATTFRKTAATEKNNFSSRSHAICRIAIANKEIPSAPDGILYLIDLAGSEAARDIVAHDPQRMKETREINVSLSILKDCIRGRAQLDAGSAGKKPYIPFRQSALTKALKHVFNPEAGRKCKTSVVACVNPGWMDIAPSKNTLRFAGMLRVAIAKELPALQFDPKVPNTWSNKQVREWIVKNSGTPAVDPENLAPFHTGVQLVRMSLSEFIERCMKTPGVEQFQAKAFYDKMWGMHIDSQVGRRLNDAVIDNYVRPSSAVGPEVARIPFQDRIRPGMVVRYKPTGNTGLDLNMAMILSPEWAIETELQDFKGEIVKKREHHEGPQGVRRYLCAMISPGLMTDAYELKVWRQVLIQVEDMEAEIIMEYDTAMRYYFMCI